MASDRSLSTNRLDVCVNENVQLSVTAVYNNTFPCYFIVLLCRSGRGRKLSGDQITLPTTVDFSSAVPKKVSIVSIHSTYPEKLRD